MWKDWDCEDPEETIELLIYVELSSCYYLDRRLAVVVVVVAAVAESMEVEVHR